MASTTMDAVAATGTTKRYHEFHAEAHALHGELTRPIKQKIERHSLVELKDERGGHLARFSDDVNFEGLISFKSAHTRVSGSMTIKRPGWLTTSTSVVEGLNVFEVVTADRVVSQVTTEHPYDRTQAPVVSFLGTKVENLRVCGIPVDLTYNFGVCGTVKNDDESYLSRDSFLAGIKKEILAIKNAGFLSGDAQTQYDAWSTDIDTIPAKVAKKVPCNVTCSVVKSIDIEQVRKQIPGVKAVENVLFIPNFGALSLGEVEVGMEYAKVSQEFRRHELASGNGDQKMSKYFRVTMLTMHLGCIGHGNVQVASGKSNGNTAP